MFTLENLQGLTVQSVGVANYYGYFGDTSSPLYMLTGYIVYFTNGYKTVTGGGGRGGEDYIMMTVLDENNNIVAQFEDQI